MLLQTTAKNNFLTIQITKKLHTPLINVKYKSAYFSIFFLISALSFLIGLFKWQNMQCVLANTPVIRRVSRTAFHPLLPSPQLGSHIKTLIEGV